jgi:hypothetical protein
MEGWSSINRAVTSLALDTSSGHLYASGEETLVRWDGKAWTTISAPTYSPWWCNFLFVDASNRLLYAGCSFKISGSSVEFATMNIVTSTWSPVRLPQQNQRQIRVNAFELASPPACAAGDVPTTSGGSCTPCRPGTYVEKDGAGKIHHSRKCTPCPLNTYNAATFSAAFEKCAACPPGTRADDVGSIACTKSPQSDSAGGLTGTGTAAPPLRKSPSPPPLEVVDYESSARANYSGSGGGGALRCLVVAIVTLLFSPSSRTLAG